MTPEQIQRLRDICAQFKSYRDNTVDGNGNNLHDIKNTFDYVRKSLEEYNIVGTKFGEQLSNKAETAGNVLSQLWLCLQELEKTIELFCDQQEETNNEML